MRVYLAGPLFSEAERSFLARCAERLRAAGYECFVPHEREQMIEELTPRSVLSLDCDQGVMPAHALVAWLDGAQIDDGTACEIGLFYGLMKAGQAWRKGIVGLATDLRIKRRAQAGVQEMNLFVAGMFETSGGVHASLDDVLARLDAWRAELESGAAQATATRSSR